MRVLNWKELVTKEMIKYWSKNYKDAHPGSKEAALLYWMILGS